MPMEGKKQAVRAWPRRRLSRQLVQRGVSVAPRSTNPERMRQNLTLVKLSEQEMDALSSIHKEDPSRHTRLLSSIWDPETGRVLNGWTLEKLGWDVGYKYK
ncbi:hypothetical protein OC861_005643 [Tilletia horrida]|nr:hypothetical protein OC845_005480 [Tilletia horrida]KAK0561818.1 hypothetical protein OC861_005643 [Tilletia horrida]